MKMNCWLMLGAMLAVSATAQNSSNALPEIPAPVVGSPSAVTAPAPELMVPETIKSNTPAKKAPVKAKKKIVAKVAPKKIAFTEPTITLVPGPAEVCVSNLNVRGQAGLKGEVVAHVQKGESVTVLSEITLDKHKADEPAQWAKIALPASVDVWVNSSYIDEATKTIKPKKLNLRAGPGENYSVIGVIERGTPVTESGTKGSWTKIDAPTNAYAFIAALYLKQEASGNVPQNPAPSTETQPLPTTPMTVTETQPIVAEAPANPPAAPELNSVPAPVLNPTVIIQTNIIVENDNAELPPPPRVVTHEGVVRSSVSLVAPTYFELYDPATQKAINYLFSTTTNLNLARYNGLLIDVTGAEGLDARWKDTPVLTVQKIYVLSTNVMTKPAPVLSPRNRGR
jgi:uncharacterized protein YgiM (DUF1202 family)